MALCWKSYAYVHISYQWQIVKGKLCPEHLMLLLNGWSASNGVVVRTYKCIMIAVQMRLLNYMMPLVKREANVGFRNNSREANFLCPPFLLIWKTLTDWGKKWSSHNKPVFTIVYKDINRERNRAKSFEDLLKRLAPIIRIIFPCLMIGRFSVLITKNHLVQRFD